jgi:hypothetical protein
MPNKDPPEGRTTAIVAVMRGRPKHGHHRQHSNKHYKQKLVWVLLDSGSDGDLVFVDKNKPMLLPSSKRLVPQLWNTSNGRFQTKFFEYSNSKKYLAELYATWTLHCRGLLLTLAALSDQLCNHNQFCLCFHRHY